MICVSSSEKSKHLLNSTLNAQNFPSVNIDLTKVADYEYNPNTITSRVYVILLQKMRFCNPHSLHVKYRLISVNSFFIGPLINNYSPQAK